MSQVIYNTLTRKKEPFTPLEEGKVKMYVCGVTTYDLCHIGHARCYVAFDVVQRWLRKSGYDVLYVRNITDVDDKIIKRAAERSIEPQALADQFVDEMHADFAALDIQLADVEPRVSTHIEQIVAIIERLFENDLAYAVDGDVYFDTTAFAPYGALSGRNLDDLKAGARVDVDERKRSSPDFALWKSHKPGEPWWDSPWGKGRPGWHIECSAMSCTHLGDVFDLHGGGMDLIFPHHENEIAQSHGAAGAAPVNVWMHNGFVNVDNEKMSKSLDNFFTIRTVLEVYNPQTVRYFLMTTHYRNPINYSTANLDEAAARITYMYDTLRVLDEALASGIDTESGPIIEAAVVDAIIPNFEAAMNDDFNTPSALGHLSDVLKLANLVVRMKRKRAGRGRTLRVIREGLASVSEVLGVLNRDPVETLDALKAVAIKRLGIDVAEIDQLVAQRIAARVAKDWALADELRNAIVAKGIEVMDTADGTDWRPLLGVAE